MRGAASITSRASTKWKFGDWLYITSPCLLRSADIKTESLTIPAAPASDANICSQQVIPTNPPYFPPPPSQITCVHRRRNLGRNALNRPSLLKFDLSPCKNIPFSRDSDCSFEWEDSTSLTTRILGLRQLGSFYPRLKHTQLDAVSSAGLIDNIVTTSRQTQIQAKADLALKLFHFLQETHICET